MEDFVYVVVLLLISAIPAIQKGIQKKSKPKKKRMSASGNITNVITSDSAISLTFSPEQPEQTKTTTAVDGRPIYQHPRRQKPRQSLLPMKQAFRGKNRFLYTR